jgi:hypothetical protein
VLFDGTTVCAVALAQSEDRTAIPMASHLVESDGVCMLPLVV